jgi:RimJ/RimL family protein N-acetyltransferase
MFLNVPGPAYRIVTPRLEIRCYDPADAPVLKSAIDNNLDYLRQFLYWAYDHPISLDRHLTWLRKTRSNFDLGLDFVYGIFTGEESELIGGIGLHSRGSEGTREIGYWIHQDYAGQGLGTEATSSLVKTGFEIENIHRIVIHCDPRNHASAAIPRKLGFQLETVLRSAVQGPDGAWEDRMLWTLLETEYPQSPAARLPVQAFDAAGERIF